MLLAAPLAGQNQAPFDAATVMAGDEERFVKTADLDGDGFVEAVGWWRVGTDPSGEFIHRLSGYHNDHTGKLARVWMWNSRRSRTSGVSAPIRTSAARWRTSMVTETTTS